MCSCTSRGISHGSAPRTRRDNSSRTNGLPSGTGWWRGREGHRRCLLLRCGLRSGSHLPGLDALLVGARVKKIVIDVGCARYGGDYSIERLIEKFDPDALYGFDPAWEPRMVDAGAYRTHIEVSTEVAWTRRGLVHF